MTAIAVVGAGAVGGPVGAGLATKPGVEVTFCVRRPFARLEVEHLDGTVTSVSTAVCTGPAEAATPASVDWVVLATKAHQTAGAGPWLTALCQPDTKVVVLQNGVEHVERVHRYVPPAEVVPAVVHYGAEGVAPGRVQFRLAGDVLVPASPAGLAFAALAEGGLVAVRPVEDWHSEAWRKLAMNVASSCVSGLAVVRANLIGREAALRSWATSLIDECVAVGRADGAGFPQSFATEVVDGFARVRDDVLSSTCQDRLRGLPLEHEALAGAVVRAGQRHGIPTPRCRAAVDLLDAVSATQLPTQGGVT